MIRKFYNNKHKFNSNSLVLILPYIWMFIFFILPFLLVLKISISEMAVSVPPYKPLWIFIDNKLTIFLNFANYIALIEDLREISYIPILFSIFTSTLISVVLGILFSKSFKYWQYSNILSIIILIFWFLFLNNKLRSIPALNLDNLSSFLAIFWQIVLYTPLAFSLILLIQNKHYIQNSYLQELIDFNNNGFFRTFVIIFIIALIGLIGSVGEDSLYIDAYLNSLKIAMICTFICFLIGYPMAYAISKTKPSLQLILLLLVTLPAWVSLLIKVYAWMSILGNQGILNNILLFLGIVEEPLKILNTDTAIYIGLVYVYLPFMILPLYANLSKQDSSLLEAANDLGSSDLNSFWLITFNLSKNAIFTGCLLVFIPCVGEFVVPELLGGSSTSMIGKVLWEEFFNNRDWPVASALAIIMLLILIIPINIFNKYNSQELEIK